MRAVSGSRPRLLPGRRARRAGERDAGGGRRGGAVGARALILGGARSGKSLYAERMAGAMGARVLYVATALPHSDPELLRRVRLHRERRPAAWGTVEAGDLARVPGEAGRWDAVLLDSLTLWVSARLHAVGEGETLAAFEGFLDEVSALPTPFVLVSDEVGLGVVPESPQGRAFRDVLGIVNQRAAAAAGEVHLCVAGIGVRIK